MMNHNHLMIDVETLSLKENAAILSIGACTFDLESRTIGKDFHMRCNPFTEGSMIFDISYGTLQWWFHQSDAARKSIMVEEGALSVSLRSALTALHEFRTESNVDYTWARGPQFDLRVIEYATLALCALPSRLKERPMFDWYKVRDVRSVTDFIPKIVLDKIYSKYTTHDALEDCHCQCECLFFAADIADSYAASII